MLRGSTLWSMYNVKVPRYLQHVTVPIPRVVGMWVPSPCTPPLATGGYCDTLATPPIVSSLVVFSFRSLALTFPPGFGTSHADQLTWRFWNRTLTSRNVLANTMG